MAALSLVALVVILGFAWIATSYPSQRGPKLDALDYSAKVESAPSCETLKGLCRNLAVGYGDQNAHIAFLSRTSDEIFRRLGLLLVGWAGLSAAGFLYIFSILWRHERETKVAP
jgi:hypothetical protein